MKKTLLSVLSIVAFVGCLNAQTTYLDFEGPVPAHSTFNGSDFAVAANPDKTGVVNTSDNVAMTKKNPGAAIYGGIVFPVGGTIDFAAGTQTFTIDVLSSVAGTVILKFEKADDANINMEAQVLYTTPGQWQTLSFAYTDKDPGVYGKVVLFMGYGTTDTDVWYYDNLKGPDYTSGANVNATFEITDLGGTATSVDVELSNDPGYKIALSGTPGAGAKWTTDLTDISGSTITAPITYTVYVNGTAVPEITDVDFLLAGSATTKIAKNYGIAPEGADLITNGTFDGMEGAIGGVAANGWSMYSANGSTVAVIDGVANVTPVASGDNWQMQLIQMDCPIQNGKTYTITFKAWADADRIIALSVEDSPDNGYTVLGATSDPGTIVEGRSKWTIDITTEPTTYTRTMTVDAMVTSTVVKFVFLMAQTADKVYLDDVKMVESSNVSIRDNKANALRLYPNPAVNDLYISGKTTQSKVEIYNVVGKQVKVYGNILQSIDVSDLNTGVYFVKLTDVTGKTVTSKFIKK